jgi:hypothetical protein
LLVYLDSPSLDHLRLSGNGGSAPRPSMARCSQGGMFITQ